MFSIISTLLLEKPVWQRAMFKTPQTPKRVKEMMQSHFPAVVVFVKSDCDDCKEFLTKVAGPAEKLVGIAGVI